ncbi:Hypothetical protein R9X50_00613800 [Acrodontium crateriforme]|uniref:Uncharacterized protein n=1 Tax=Acrodontium crateriforme TaxID=150365 RepID=A0AAQ3R6K3_9PEZI|nr:Hypothetical protein R9X50_00613800 [Acrodontium crateriforme]
MPSNANPKRLAILDDYAEIAKPYFNHIPNLIIDSFPSTLNPFKPNDLEALITRLEPYDIISTMRERTPFPSTLQDRLPRLELLLTTSTRNNAIDLPCATKRGVVVTGTQGDRPSETEQSAKLPDLPPPRGYSAVTQHSWALLLALCSRVTVDDAALKNPELATSWQSGAMVSLAGKTLGIVGLGKLGVGMAKIAILGFGMRVVAWSENLTSTKARDVLAQAGLPLESVQVVSKEALFRDADVVSLHLVLSDRSRGIIGARELALMRSSALLINTARSGLVDEDALIDVLKQGKIAGAALDVFSEEPLPSNSEWRRSSSWKSDVVLSPHMGYSNAGTLHRWYQEQADNVERWMRGDELLNRMN